MPTRRKRTEKNKPPEPVNVEVEPEVVSELVLEARTDDDRAIAALAAFKVGQRALDDGDCEAAVAAYDQALAIAPGFVEATYNRASALLSLERLNEAFGGYFDAISLDPSLTPACNNAGAIAIQLGDYAAAVDLFLRSLEVDPRQLGTLQNVGNALVLTGDIEGARKVAAELEQLDTRRSAELSASIDNPPSADRATTYRVTPDGALVDEAFEDPLVAAAKLLARIEREEREDREDRDEYGVDDDEDEPSPVPPADPDTDLVLAAYFGDVLNVKRALASGASPDARQKGTGYSALLLAVSNDHAEVVQTLLARGADANTEATVEVGGRRRTVTALARADDEGKTEIARLLREHGAR